MREVEPHHLGEADVAMIRKNFPLFLAFLLALSLDIVSKSLANQNLVKLEPVSLFGEWLRVTLHYNTGVAFGLFANGGPWPLVVTGVILAGLAAWLVGAIRSGELPFIAGWPVGMILDGAVGNFADRVTDGRVTDFLDFGLGAVRWPTFNLADSFVVVGVAILLWTSLMGKNSEQDRQP